MQPSPPNPAKGPTPEDRKTLDIEYHRHAAGGYDDAVTRHFDTYHRHSLHPWARRLARDVPDAYALDLGTGTGVVACTLARYGCRVRAVDHSLDMLARATARARAAGVADRVAFDLGDCERLAYADATFDAVTMQGVLHHLPDICAALVEALRVLKPGGRVYISEPCVERSPVARAAWLSLSPLRRLRDLARGRRPEPPVSDHEAPISGPAVVALVRSLGVETRQEYLANFGAIRFLPGPLRIWAVLALSIPSRGHFGDLIFLTGRKTSRVTEAPTAVAGGTPGRTIAAPAREFSKAP